MGALLGEDCLERAERITPTRLALGVCGDQLYTTAGSSSRPMSVVGIDVDTEAIDIARISLNERRCGFSRGHWFYVFDFDPVEDGKVQLGTEQFIAIMMDGTVLPPNDPPPTD